MSEESYLILPKVDIAIVPGVVSVVKKNRLPQRVMKAV
jgi:hypothetical protein